MEQLFTAIEGHSYTAIMVFAAIWILIGELKRK